MKKNLFITFALVLMAAFGVSQKADACSRILYVGNDSLRIVGRSLDWKTPIPTNVYVYPRGITKVGSDAPGAVKWTSKYGAVYAVSYDSGITEGMNEMGLSVNGLFCKGTIYVNEKTTGRPPMSLAMFVAWMLDMNATTPEVIAQLKNQDFTISGATFDGGTVSTLHWGVTDAQGRSAIFEFNKGNLIIHEGQDMLALTNDPQFDAMTAINDYWKAVGGINMLPGTVRSSDRFVRGYFFAGHVKKTGDADLGVSIIRSILNNVSVPYQYAIETEPNVSSTQWRSFSNLRDRTYYFDLVTNLGMFYIDLKKCDLRKGAPILKFDTAKHTNVVGDITHQLEKTKGFTPMY
ncbi:MAG: linear amide C-N hydrolase [Firmicutes bacterium]|nr:linear amide C-N hydrolase [Bacillota bacterium]MCM1401427.1 linear amide C-N hydrolase [Bacteroides sp.]MCM1477303.1 linear amide C-N hydrolase [Bacteroides sp.]